MKSKSFLPLLIAYIIPYAFIALLGDYALDIMWGYRVMVVVLLVADIFRARNFGMIPAALGNILSGAVSYRACVGSGLNKRTWFFKPFTPAILVVLMTVAAVIVRVLIAKVVKKPAKQDRAEEIEQDTTV